MTMEGTVIEILGYPALGADRTDCLKDKVSEERTGHRQVFLWLTRGSSFFSRAICSCKKLGIDHLANPHKDYLIYNRF